MNEAMIIINGTQITNAMCMTIRVDVEAFAAQLVKEGLGDDEHGRAMTEGYQAKISGIRSLMYPSG